MPHPACRPAHRRTRPLSGAILSVALVLLAAAGPTGCSGDDVEAPSIENFARSWHLTKCEYAKEADPAVKVNLVAQGWAVDLFINDNGHFLYAWTPPAGTQESFGGTWTVDGSHVALTREGNAFAWTFATEVTETGMTMTGAHAEYDFDQDGTPDAALWNLAGTNDN